MTFMDIDSIDTGFFRDIELKDVDRSKKVINVMWGTGIFDRITACMGFENSLIAMMEEPEECYECGEKSARWIQGSDGTFGVKCKDCGSEAWADLNTPCELDETDYQISIMPFSAGKEELLFVVLALERVHRFHCGVLL